MMNSQTIGYTKRQAGDDVVERNNEVFFEADRLDTQAYKIIESYSVDAQMWACFIEAKKVADAHRTAAYQEWMRIHRAKRK